MRYVNAEDFMQKNGYSINNAWYPRVTKILEVKSKPGLDAFFKEVGSYDFAEEIKNKSAEEGSLVHETVQKLACGEPIIIPEQIRPAAETFLDFIGEKNIIFHPDFIERQVWSNFHKYAGTVDALASINGKFAVLHIKTSTGFYPEYNLQTAAYVLALQETEIKKAISLPSDIETRWILRVDQHKVCEKCNATLREKGGRSKIRGSKFLPTGQAKYCLDLEHNWGEAKGIVEIREFPYFYRDIKAFLAAKTLWEWENDYWLRQIGYLK
ncbi:MAG: hypothetical protein AAB522_01270 [Patescibacteria group bacterium]